MTRNSIPMPARLRRFAADQSGVSAVEFAILLPLMLTMYLGGVEVSQAVSADRKTTLVAAYGRRPGRAGDQRHHRRHDQRAQCRRGGRLSVLGEQPQGDGDERVHRRDRHHATVAWSRTQNGTAHSGVVTSSIPTALMVAKHVADLGRGDLRLQADRRLDASPARST